jgi:hypothetical protein
MSLRQAPAIERRHPYLTVVTLHEGIVDLRKNIPATDVVLLAATAMLVARTDLHPALSDLLLKAAKEVHGPGALLERAGQFPSPFHVDIPLSAEAERFHRSGVPFLYRYLPFWAATLADRMKVLLIPLVTLLLPLFKLAPLLYQWHVRSKIYRWYADLRSVENGMGDEPENRLREKLAWIETEVTKVSVPLSYADDLYHLRLHIALVREKLGAGPGPGG